MKILIAEDDLASRKFISKMLSVYGECDMAVDGLEAVDAFMISITENIPYDLICLDIMMPKMDGVKVLKTIRNLEEQYNIPPERKVKIIMTTALSETEIIQKSFEYECDAYASKPIDMEKFKEVMQKIGLIE